MGKTLSAGAPWARLRWETSRRRRIAHAGGVILAQDGSWRFFDRGGDGGNAGRVLPDRTVGDFGRLARQGFFSLRRAAQINSRWRWRLTMQSSKTARALEHKCAGKPVLFAGQISRYLARGEDHGTNR